MEEAVAVRRAALDAVEGVEPTRLHDRIAERLEDGSMAPGVLAVVSAAAVDDGIGRDGVVDRAAGVQLIYEGLRLTRTLVHEEPWLAVAALDGSTRDGNEADETNTRDVETDASSADDGTDASDGGVAASDGEVTAGDADTRDGKSAAAAAADVDVLVADILVARGFYLLARTEAADAAVGVVQSFGRDQTVRRETDDPSLDGNLEADVFELAVVAGTTAAGATTPIPVGEFVTDLPTDGDLPPAEAVFDAAVIERLHALVGTDTSAEGARTSADY